jgi:PAT family beta-lactamase induction signal transducer AmpG
MNGRKWTALVLLGLASGLPLALSGDLLAAWLSDAGFDPAKIGLLGLAGLPYAFKVIWSPLADRYRPPILGRRRGWIIGSQVLLIAAIWILSETNPRQSLLAVGAAATAVAFFSATQDIVIDAWRADVLEESQRGPGAAVSVAGYRLGMIASGAGMLILVGHFHISWPAACRLTGLALMAGIAGALLAEEPPAVHRPVSMRQAIGEPLRHLLAQSGGWTILLFVTMFKLPEYLASGMSLPFLMSMGYPKEQIGAIRQGLGVGVTIVGVLLGGGLVRRMGVWRSLWVLGLLLSASDLIYLPLARMGPNDKALLAVITTQDLCIGMTTAGFLAWMIAQCDARFSAFQFALLSSFAALGRVLAIPLSGRMAHALGWTGFFIVSAMLGLPGLYLLRRLAHLPLKTSSTVVVKVSNEEAETVGACTDPLT